MTRYRLVYLTAEGNRVTGQTLMTSLTQATRLREYLMKHTSGEKIRDIEIEEVEVEEDATCAIWRIPA